MRSTALLCAAWAWSGVSATLYFNATLQGSDLTVRSWDDTNNDGKPQPQDVVCAGDGLRPVATNQWRVPCTGGADRRSSDAIFDVFLEPVTRRFLDVIYRYSNPAAAALNVGDAAAAADQFLFTFRVASVDGTFFKTRQFGAQQDILNLVKPEALKNPCDSLDSC